mgnify:CR=1 FL=1
MKYRDPFLEDGVCAECSEPYEEQTGRDIECDCCDDICDGCYKGYTFFECSGCHQNECDGCASGSACENCEGYYYCFHCRDEGIRSCSCGNDICIQCVESNNQCVGCDATLCRECKYKCERCNVLLCDECSDSNATCENCVRKRKNFGILRASFWLIVFGLQTMKRHFAPNGKRFNEAKEDFDKKRSKLIE